MVFLCLYPKRKAITLLNANSSQPIALQLIQQHTLRTQGVVPVSSSNARGTSYHTPKLFSNANIISYIHGIKHKDMFSFKNKCGDCGKKVHTVASDCTRCKACMKNKQKEYGANHRKKMKGLPKPIPTPKTPKQRYSTYKSGAIKRNHAFELTEEQFMTFWDKPCHYCEQPINGIGIDRLDNSIGYVVENCVPCCTVCNMMKFKQSYKHFIAKCAQIAKVHSVD